MTRLPLVRDVRIATDYSLNVFEDLDLNLYDLHLASHGVSPGVIIGRTFRGCRIQGPAIMLVSVGVRFSDCNFGAPDGDMQSLVLRPVGRRAFGTVPFRETLFEGCEFYNVGFTGPEDMLNDLLAVGKS